jgi:hypothetical protein
VDIKEILIRQIEGIRARLLLLSADLDVLSGCVDQAISDPPQLAPQEIDGVCVHPVEYRIPCPAGGRNVNRFICSRCKAEGGVAPRGDE